MMVYIGGELCQEALGDEPVFQSSVELEDGSIPEGMKATFSTCSRVF